MISISLCLIVKNEEQVLDRCLESAAVFSDEIIVVDTGSDDRTKEIARKYTDKIYDFKWSDDFSAARNFAFDKGEKDFLMWLDADDIVPDASIEKMLKLKESLSLENDVVMMPYEVAFDEQGNAVFSYFRERIVRNFKGYYFTGKIHEVIPPCGKIVYMDIPIEHRKKTKIDGDRNLRIYEKMKSNGEWFDSRSLYYYGRELYSHGKYEEAGKILEEFLDRPDGWVENCIDATRQLAYCYYGMKMEKEALGSLLRGLEYDVPRGETCCDLGRHFFDRGRYNEAIYWYMQAFSAKKALKSGAFVREECYGFLPAISLCVIYDKIGNRELAKKYHELTGKYNSASLYYKRNCEYFSGKIDSDDSAGLRRQKL